MTYKVLIVAGISLLMPIICPISFSLNFLNDGDYSTKRYF